MGRHVEKDTVEEELDPRTTLEIEAFLAWLDVQRGLSPTTQIAYGTDLRQLALFLAQRGQPCPSGRGEQKAYPGLAGPSVRAGRG